MESIHRNIAPRKSRTQGMVAARRPHNQANASLVPAIRTALVKDARLYEYLMGNAGALRRRQPSAIQYLARRCMQWQELEQPREGETCRQLGCGTAARLERLAPNMHRDEVAVFGILVDVAYAYLAGVLSIADLERAVSLIDALGFTLFTPELYALAADVSRRSKVDRSQPSLLLLKGIGAGVELQAGDPSLLDHAVRLIDSWGGEAVHWANMANVQQR
jgi:3-dehydroquinate synthase